jgi:hypothetical protein
MGNNLPRSFMIRDVVIRVDHIGTSHGGYVDGYVGNHINPSITNTTLQ